jgi:hypothetical protein
MLPARLSRGSRHRWWGWRARHEREVPRLGGRRPRSWRAANFARPPPYSITHRCQGLGRPGNRPGPQGYVASADRVLGLHAPRSTGLSTRVDNQVARVTRGQEPIVRGEVPRSCSPKKAKRPLQSYAARASRRQDGCGKPVVIGDDKRLDVEKRASSILRRHPGELPLFRDQRTRVAGSQ